MKLFFLVLMLLAGLRNSISFAQTVQSKDPFARYLAGLSSGTPEEALQRFSNECNIDTTKNEPRFAVGPGSSFTQVKNMAKGLKRLETDFYSTAEVWITEDRVLVESWANSDDVGSEARYLKCFVNHKLTQAQVVTWTVPVSQSSHEIIWGYSRRWERGSDGRLQRTKAEFVNGMEEKIPKPKLDYDGEKSLRWIPPLGPLEAENLPRSMLR